MYNQEIFIATDKDQNQEEIIDAMHVYLGALRQGGQIYEKFQPMVKNERGLSVFVLTPEEHSLSEQCATKYSSKRREELEKQAKVELEISIIGIDPEMEGVACDCQEPSFYILFTNYIKVGSPLRCGDCFGQIPLYYLKGSEGYYEVLCWESDYVSCDSLQMNCRTGERFATKQLSDHQSSLSKSGLEICKTIEEKTGKPTFYYLYNYRKISEAKDRGRKCPSCGGDWLLEESLHNIFDFKCDTCGLLSNLSWRS